MSLRFSCLSALACLLATPAFAQTSESADPVKAKTEMYGGALTIQYGIDNCDITTTKQQRDTVKQKLADFKQQSGLTGELSQAQIKDIAGIKSDDDLKTYCTGLQLMLPGVIADMVAEKPPAQWGKPAQAAQAAPAAPAPSAPAAPDAAAQATPAAPAAAAPPTTSPAASGSVTVGDWEVGRFDEKVPGDCMMVREYKDKNDGDAENVVVLRSTSGSLRVGFHYAKWNWKAGQGIDAALVSPDAVVDADAQWKADKTGKTITTDLKPERLAAMKGADQLIVKLDDSDAYFDTPKISDAIAALTTCVQSK